MAKLRATWMFHALADETRLRVVRLLASGGSSLNAGDIAKILRLPPSHLSQHLRLLEMSGLTVATKVGRCVQIELNSDDMSTQSIVAAVLALRDAEGILNEDLVNLMKFHQS